MAAPQGLRILIQALSNYSVMVHFSMISAPIHGPPLNASPSCPLGRGTLHLIAYVCLDSELEHVMINALATRNVRTSDAQFATTSD